jgi:hypothetical protein
LCGATHAFFHLTQFDWAGAYQSNPGITPLMALLLANHVMRTLICLRPLHPIFAMAWRRAWLATCQIGVVFWMLQWLMSLKDVA